MAWQTDPGELGIARLDWLLSGRGSRNAALVMLSLIADGASDVEVLAAVAQAVEEAGASLPRRSILPGDPCWPQAVRHRHLVRAHTRFASDLGMSLLPGVELVSDATGALPFVDLGGRDFRRASLLLADLVGSRWGDAVVGSLELAGADLRRSEVFGALDEVDLRHAWIGTGDDSALGAGPAAGIAASPTGLPVRLGDLGARRSTPVSDMTVVGTSASVTSSTVRSMTWTELAAEIGQRATLLSAWRLELAGADERRATMSCVGPAWVFLQHTQHALLRFAAQAMGVVAGPLLGEDLLPRRSGASLHLSGMSLAGRDLRGADLRGADLTNTDLRNARLEGADLAFSDLRGADLGGALGLDDALFAGAWIDDSTNLAPQGQLLLRGSPIGEAVVLGSAVAEVGGVVDRSSATRVVSSRSGLSPAELKKAFQAALSGEGASASRLPEIAVSLAGSEGGFGWLVDLYESSGSTLGGTMVGVAGRELAWRDGRADGEILRFVGLAADRGFVDLHEAVGWPLAAMRAGGRLPMTDAAVRKWLEAGLADGAPSRVDPVLETLNRFVSAEELGEGDAVPAVLLQLVAVQVAEGEVDLWRYPALQRAVAP